VICRLDVWSNGAVEGTALYLTINIEYAHQKSTMMNSTDIIQQDSPLSSIIGSPQARREIRFFVDYGSTVSIYANASINHLLQNEMTYKVF
jgi:hypothetical protein